MAWDRILTLHSSYDGPREGVATFGGQSYLFESQFSEAEDELTDLFLLMRVTPDLAELEQEFIQIFEAWRSAPEGKKHPALSGPDSRYHELRKALRVVKERSIAAHGEFRCIGPQDGPRAFLVKWSVVSSEGSDPLAFANTGNSIQQPRRPIAHALIPIIELGASGPDAVVAAAEAVAEEARALSWYQDRLADQTLSDEQWVQLLDSGDEAIGECRTGLQRYAAGATAAELIESLRRVAGMLRRRP